MLKCFAVFPGCVFVIHDVINKAQIKAYRYLNSSHVGSAHLALLSLAGNPLEPPTGETASPTTHKSISLHIYTHTYACVWVYFLSATNFGDRNGQCQLPLYQIIMCFLCKYIHFFYMYQPQRFPLTFTPQSVHRIHCITHYGKKNMVTDCHHQELK